MERALTLKIFHFVVLVGTTNWQSYSETGHCRKEIFFFKIKKIGFSSSNKSQILIFDKSYLCE